MDFIDFSGNKAKVIIDENGIMHINITLGAPIPEEVNITDILASIGYLPAPTELTRTLRVIK